MAAAPLPEVPLKKFDVILIRHGQSAQNAGEYNGIHDSQIPLTNLGMQQAHKAGEFLYRFVREQGIDLKRARIWSSPYERAIVTAQTINEYLGLPEIKKDICLREREYGSFGWYRYEDWQKIDPAAFENITRCQEAGARVFAEAPFGESALQVVDRVNPFRGTIARDREFNGIDTVFIFSHGWTIRGLVFATMHYDIKWLEHSENPENCSIWYIQGKQVKTKVPDGNGIARTIRNYQYKDLGYIYQG